MFKSRYENINHQGIEIKLDSINHDLPKDWDKIVLSLVSFATTSNSSSDYTSEYPYDMTDYYSWRWFYC